MGEAMKFLFAFFVFLAVLFTFHFQHEKHLSCPPAGVAKTSVGVKITMTKTDENNKANLPRKEELSAAVRKVDAHHRFIQQAAEKERLTAKLIKAVIAVESMANPFAVSEKGAQGLMQLIPSTQRLVGVRHPFDPAENIAGGARYLRICLDKFGGDIDSALAAYQMGPELLKNKINDEGYSPSQSDYVQKVKKTMALF